MNAMEHVEAHLHPPQCISAGKALTAANRRLCMARIPVAWRPTARLDETINEGDDGRFDGISTRCP